MKWLYVTGRSQRRRLAAERERERWTVRARLAAWLMDWLAGLPSWLAAAERTEMHRGTEQTQTCHFRRLIQSVMIFPHLAALCSLSSWPTVLLWTLAAQLFYQCAPTDLHNGKKGKGNQSFNHNRKSFICFGQCIDYSAIPNRLKGLNHVKQEYDL